MFYVFIEYIPRNVHVEKPSVIDRFFNIKQNPRISKGEWVVKKLFLIETSYHHYLQSISSTKEENQIVSFYYNELINH